MTNLEWAAVAITVVLFLNMIVLAAIGDHLRDIRNELRERNAAEARRWKADKEFYS